MNVAILSDALQTYGKLSSVGPSPTLCATGNGFVMSGLFV